MAKRKIAVFGLGRFGSRLARELESSQIEVIAVDRNGRLVEEIKDDVSVAVQMDSTNEEAMLAQNIGEADVCVVAIGEGFEATLMTTLIAKKSGARKVIARAQTEIQAEILRRVGADQVILPEHEMARSLARRLAHPSLEDFIQLDEEHGILQIRAPAAFQNRRLADLKLRNEYQVNLIGIRRVVADRNGVARERTIAVPSADEVILAGDTLILVGTQQSLARLPPE
jgi:trk system potassium uptake protein TrkA|uniref:TrkA family potassium uptake protein n=1 Tax=Schlesneria paludicola TaxID=360056 RepID=A0A7C4LQ57_9PLAN